MNRRITKYRCWLPSENKMLQPEELMNHNIGMLMTDSNWFFLQWTGLLDKQGKEIYEGDFVKWNHLMEGMYYTTKRVTDILEVTWDEKHAKYSISGISTFWTKDMLMKDLEVIGNIYENPELLEVDGK